MKKTFAASLLLALTLIGGCKTEPATEGAQKPAEAKKKKEAAAPEAKSGREAFQVLYVTARQWAADAQPVRLSSQALKENAADGKALVWGGTFVSASKKSMKPIMWSDINSAEAPPPGVTPGSDSVYNPANVSTQPFDFGALKIDSTDALAVAQKKGGAALLKKEPGTLMKYTLTWDKAKSRLLWHVQYGASETDAKLKVVVNATNGEFVRFDK